MNADQQAHFDDLYRDIVNAIARGISPDEAVGALARIQNQLYGRFPELLCDRLEALEAARLHLLEQQNRVKYLEKRSLRFGREHWYLGPAHADSLWALLKARLEGQGRHADEIDLVDTDSGIVVGLLDNPSKQHFSTKGLVVGHVQSGKTGNIAAVIAKAADTPYKFFLVLSGITDQLRNQTQVRLEADVVDLAPERWMKWTSPNSDETNGDFSERAVGGFSFDHRNQIAVVKKNAAVLRRFLAKLRNTDEATLKNTPFLIIDDECDQASVNSARYATAITKINDLIRQILAKLPRAAYVGYTATPFANVLIDTTVPADLYPRHFIHALQRPTAYFGAEELFGRRALEGDYDEEAGGYDMIRLVPPEEVERLRPARGSNSRVQVTASLEMAIRYFVMVVAARKVRGQEEKHNTMLVHTSMLNSVHRETEAVIRPYVRRLTGLLASQDSSTLTQMQREWTSEQEKLLSEQFDLQPVRFDDIASHLLSVLQSIKVHVENWTAVERLDYSGPAKTYLVIGGNVLARGLTLEGLSVSFFLRSSSQYDTLMQMGRWFGYRPGFEDLPRVWVEETVREAFFDLAAVEWEIRRDIARYADEELTPEQFAVRIRKIPGMTITAPAKMRSAVPVEVGYAGTHVQTFRFKRGDGDLLRRNWTQAANLVGQAGSAPEARGSSHVFRGVSSERVLGFLEGYECHPSHKTLSPEFLAAFVRKAATSTPRLQQWSVVVVGANGGPSRAALGSLGHVQTVIRSAEAGSGADASIKALMSKQDILLDLDVSDGLPGKPSWDDYKAVRERAGANALLLIYPIQAKSEPVRASTGKPSREALNAEFDVVGFAVVVPGDKTLSATYVAANIAPYDDEPADDVAVGDQIPETMLGAMSQGDEQ